MTAEAFYCIAQNLRVSDVPAVGNNFHLWLARIALAQQVQAVIRMRRKPGSSCLWLQPVNCNILMATCLSVIGCCCRMSLIRVIVCEHCRWRLQCFRPTRCRLGQRFIHFGSQSRLDCVISWLHDLRGAQNRANTGHNWLDTSRGGLSCSSCCC